MILLRSVLLVLVLTGCSDGSDNQARDPLTLSPLRAEPDILRGGSIVDSIDREVLLRGVNVNAFAEYWRGGEFPTTFPFSQSDAAAIASIGWNTVRLLVSWSRVEPEPGVYDEAYLDEIAGAVELLARYKVYTILDLHQDAWSATLAAREGEICPAGTEPAIGWDGAPAWATLDNGQPRCTFGGLRETSPAVRNAWIAFFSDAPGVDGQGIRTRYSRMLGHIAERFARNAAVAGYDIMNEPNAFTVEESAGLAALFTDALREIRAGEERGNGFSHLVLFEPTAIWWVTNGGPPQPFEYDDNVVYAPHIYNGGIDSGPATRASFQVARDEAGLFNGAPVLTGEWGADPDRAKPDGDTYFLDHQQLQDAFRFGATLWTWRESCGDPHKVGDYRAGLIPQVWGEFELDCATNVILGERTDLLRQLTRPLLRAAPGRISSLEYDPRSGRFRVSAERAGRAELVLFYPATQFGRPATMTQDGLDNLSWIDAPGGNLYLVATVVADNWVLEISP